MIPGREEMPFRLYTVAETKKPIRTAAECSSFPITRSRRSTAEGDCHSRAKSTESGCIGMDQIIFENY